MLIERLEILFFRRAFDREEDKRFYLFTMRVVPEPARSFPRWSLSFLTHRNPYSRGMPPRRPDMYIRCRSLPDRMSDAGKSVSLVSSDR